MRSSFMARFKFFWYGKSKPTALERFRTTFKRMNHEIAFRDGIDEFIDEFFHFYKANRFVNKTRFQEHPVKFATAIAEVFAVGKDEQKVLEQEEKVNSKSEPVIKPLKIES